MEILTVKAILQEGLINVETSVDQDQITLNVQPDLESTLPSVLTPSWTKVALILSLFGKVITG